MASSMGDGAEAAGSSIFAHGEGGGTAGESPRIVWGGFSMVVYVREATMTIWGGQRTIGGRVAV